MPAKRFCTLRGAPKFPRRNFANLLNCQFTFETSGLPSTSSPPFRCSFLHRRRRRHLTAAPSPAVFPAPSSSPRSTVPAYFFSALSLVSGPANFLIFISVQLARGINYSPFRGPPAGFVPFRAAGRHQFSN